MKKLQCMQEDLDDSLRRTNHERKARINLVKMSQRSNSRKTLRRKAQSFATIATNLAISNKNENFQRNILNIQR